MTERNKAAAALHSKEEQYHSADRRLAAIVASSDDAIIGKDLNSIITSWNDGVGKDLRLYRRRDAGEVHHVLIPEDRAGRERCDYRSYPAWRKRRAFRDTAEKAKDGQLIDVSVTASPIKDSKTGRVVGASKVARDITARKAAEASLRLFRSLVDHSGDTIEVIDPETGRFLDVNVEGPARAGLYPG